MAGSPRCMRACVCAGRAKRMATLESFSICSPDCNGGGGGGAV